jgi:hypothetical protein
MVTQNNILLNRDKNICDGLGCFSVATNIINEEIGDIGTIVLELCDDCVIKFREQ